MTDTDTGAQRNLAAMRLPELRKIAAEMGLKGTSALRKGDLIAAINGAGAAKSAPKSDKASKAEKVEQAEITADSAATDVAEKPTSARKTTRRATKAATASAQTETAQESAPAAEDKPATTRRRRATKASGAATATATAAVDNAQGESTGMGAETTVETQAVVQADANTEARTEATEAPTAGRRRRAVRHDSKELAAGAEHATAGATEHAAANDAQVSAEGAAEGEGTAAGVDEQHFESRSAARRARRNRARREQREGREQRSRRGNEDQDTAPAHESAAASEASAPTGVDKQTGEATDNAAGADQVERGERSDRGERAERNSREDRNERGDRNDRNERNERGERGERGDRNERNNREDRNNRRNRRNRRGRDRDGQGDNYNEPREDEVLQNIAGIVDVVDNNVAFVRTTGYHAGPADVYVSSQMLRRFGLRPGDAITGQVRMQGEQHSSGRGRNRQKYNPLVRVESVNGMTVEEAKARPEFAKLTPLYPNQRLHLETDPKILTTRVIDLIMPIGKGQRALIVSPPKAGKTTILQNIANAIATNNPECYLMVVLVDERPEEVTDMQRSVKGEVIASTFDRPPAEHTAVAELAIERAKRLVEQGQDVVILLDSITRLGRAYNNSSPASGRILSGGVDSNALYPPKRFLGAARNIENGGSLTIIATAMVETGSAGDTVIFEEFKGTGNAELKLDRKIAERRVFPAVDVNPSGTRKDELLLPPDEAKIMHKLRRILSALDPQQAIDLLIKQLKKTKSNGEFLMQIASSAPMAGLSEED